MVNRVSITLPNSGAPPKHAIYHFKNGNRKISISANVLYGLYGNARAIPANRQQYLRYFNTHPVNNQRALSRAQFVMSHVLQNRLGSRHINSGHAGQIRYFATLNKRLRNGTNRVQYQNIAPLLNYYNPRVFTLTPNNNKKINENINTIAQKYGVTRNAVISYITSIHANALERAAASRKMNTRGPLEATRYFFKKLQPVDIQKNNTIIKNTVLNKLLTNYYTNYSSVRLPDPKPNNQKSINEYLEKKSALGKRKRNILNQIRSHLNTIGRVPVAAAGGNNGRAAGGNNGRAAGGTQRRTTSPNRRAGRANMASSWRRKA